MRRRTALFALAAAAVAAPAAGCGLTIDATYLLGDRRYQEAVDERRPTGEQRVAVEHAADVLPDGHLQLRCARRARPIERAWTVSKTYQRRGGFDCGTYAGAAFLSGLATAILGASLGIACNHPDVELSCTQLLWAAPFALDTGYALIRDATVPPAKLIDRHTGGDTLRLGEPTSDQPVACDGVAAVALGRSTGPSAEAALSLDVAAPERLADGAIDLPLAGDALDLAAAPDAVRAWAGHPELSLWALAADGAPAPIAVDRCAALRAHLGLVIAAGLAAALARDCPSSRPPG